MSGKSELDIFRDISPQVVAESAHFQDVHPTTALDATTSIIDFSIQSSNVEYLDLNDTLISLRLKVVKGDGTNIKAGDALHPVPSNYFLNALFSDVSLSLNDTVIEGGNSMYPYKATIENALNFSDDARMLQLLPAGYSDDEDERKGWIDESKEFELAGTLHLDFLNQPKYLVPGVSVHIRLQRATETFALHMPDGSIHDGASTWKIIINQCILYVRRVKVNPHVITGHEHGFARKKLAMYPYQRTSVITYTIPTGSTSFIKENIFSNALLPKLLILGMVKSKAYTGSYDDKPFNFEHFKVNQVALYRDGQAVPYKRAYNPSFTAAKKLCTDVYVRSLIHSLQFLNTNNTLGITMSEFKEGGYGFYIYNLAAYFDYKCMQKYKDNNPRLQLRY